MSESCSSLTAGLAIGFLVGHLQRQTVKVNVTVANEPNNIRCRPLFWRREDSPSCDVGIRGCIYHHTLGVTIPDGAMKYSYQATNKGIRQIQVRQKKAYSRPLSSVFFLLMCGGVCHVHYFLRRPTAGRKVIRKPAKDSQRDIHTNTDHFQSETPLHLQECFLLQWIEPQHCQPHLQQLCTNKINQQSAKEKKKRKVMMQNSACA